MVEGVGTRGPRQAGGYLTGLLPNGVEVVRPAGPVVEGLGEVEAMLDEAQESVGETLQKFPRSSMNASACSRIQRSLR